MAILFSDSADKHKIPREDAMHALLNPKGLGEVEGRPGEKTLVFVGHPHKQTDRYLEVIAASRGNDIVVFHVMELSDAFRHLVQGGKL